MTRSVEQWMNILANLQGSDVAKRIFGDITHYREGGSNERADREQLVNAMEAWHKLRTAGKAN